MANVCMAAAPALAAAVKVSEKSNVPRMRMPQQPPFVLHLSPCTEKLWQPHRGGSKKKSKNFGNYRVGLFVAGEGVTLKNEETSPEGLNTDL